MSGREAAGLEVVNSAKRPAVLRYGLRDAGYRF